MPNDATFEASLLIVEDEAPIREGLIELFEAQDYQVRTAADGHAALEALAEGGHDLVLLDVMMPGPNGFEVLEQTRARGDDVPVLLLTARGAEEDIVRGLEAGADDYVTKPFGVRGCSPVVRAAPAPSRCRRSCVGRRASTSSACCCVGRAGRSRSALGRARSSTTSSRAATDR